MSEDFKRQIRYIVLKNNDVSRALDADQHRELLALCALVSDHREVEGKLPMQAVVVESDWSIYEQVWALVQQEAEGASPQLSLYDRLANQVADLKRELSEAKEREARLTRLLSETCGHLKGWKMSMLASTPERLLAKIEAALKEQNNG